MTGTSRGKVIPHPEKVGSQLRKLFGVYFRWELVGRRTVKRNPNSLRFPFFLT